MNQGIDRRIFLKMSAALILLPTAGCLGLLFRVVLGRGLARGLTAGLRGGIVSRVGVTNARMASIGRGTAVSTNIARTRGVKLASGGFRGIITSTDKRVLAHSESRDGKTIVRDNRNNIGVRSFSNQDDVIVHTDRFGNEIGRSFRETDEVTRHFGPNGRGKIGSDRFDRALDIIDHLNEVNELMGRTKVTDHSDSEFSAETDSAMESIIAEFSGSDPLGNCPKAQDVAEQIEKEDSNCISGAHQACRKASQLNAKLLIELSACKL